MFPTGVGMNRASEAFTSLAWDVPHGCGDEPQVKDQLSGQLQCSPRVWG